MRRLGHSRFCAAPDDDTNASFRTKSQSFLHGARNCSEWPDKLLPVASITASARRSTLRFEPDQTHPFIVSGAAKQRSSRCPAALIITSCTSVSLTLMIQPFLSSRRPDDPGPLTRTSPGSTKADGAVGSRALAAPRLTPMLPFERQTSRF